MKQYTVEDRFNIMMKATSVSKLSVKEQQQLNNALYTLSEHKDVSLYIQDALEIHAIVNIVLAGKFTEEMRL